MSTVAFMINFCTATILTSNGKRPTTEKLLLLSVYTLLQDYSDQSMTEEEINPVTV